MVPLDRVRREKSLVARALASPRLREVGLARHIDRMPYFRVVQSASRPTTRVEGRDLLNFASNNYLGMATDPRVVGASSDALRKWGTGVTGSRFMNGNLGLHLQLEEEIGDFLGKDASLVFPTGYTAGLGLLSGLTRSGDLLLADQEIHASIRDGARLSGASLQTFEHNDPVACGQLLEQQAEVAMCVIEGVYSMSGDIAPVGAVAAECAGSPALLVVDEAHGLGVLGEGARGAAEHAGVGDLVDVFLMTFSKSLGGCGGAIVGDRELIEAIRFAARPFMFTASNTPASLAGALASLRILREHPEYGADVRGNAARFSAELAGRGIRHRHSGAAIVSLHVGADMKTAQAWKMLWNRGVFCNASVSPAVPYGNGTLRFSVMRTHATAEIVDAACICADVLTELEVTLGVDA